MTSSVSTSIAFGDLSARRGPFVGAAMPKVQPDARKAAAASAAGIVIVQNRKRMPASSPLESVMLARADAREQVVFRQDIGKGGGGDHSDRDFAEENTCPQRSRSINRNCCAGGVSAASRMRTMENVRLTFHGTNG